MYRCSVRELSVRNDGQSESEHANLTDVPLVYYNMANRFDLCFEHYIWNTGFAPVVRLIHTRLRAVSFARKAVGKHGRKNSKQHLRASVICKVASRLLHSPLACHACRHAHFPYGFSSKRETAGSLDTHSSSSVQKRCPTEPSVRYAIFERWICPSGSNDDRSPMELSLRYV